GGRAGGGRLLPLPRQVDLAEALRGLGDLVGRAGDQDGVGPLVGGDVVHARLAAGGGGRGGGGRRGRPHGERPEPGETPERLGGGPARGPRGLARVAQEAGGGPP